MPETHSFKPYDVDLEAIRSQVMLMGGLVESQLVDAIACFRTGDAALADQVIAVDQKVNRLEVSLDDGCSHLIVRHQPIANDLRTVLATGRVITDLERIGDEATKIARTSKFLHQRGILSSIDHFNTIRLIGDEAKDILHTALDVFATLDSTTAITLIAKDEAIDTELHAVSKNLISYMMEDPRTISMAIDMFWIAKALERIGDHAKNIAEHVVYIVDGKDIRHSNHSTGNSLSPMSA